MGKHTGTGTRWKGAGAPLGAGAPVLLRSLAARPPALRASAPQRVLVTVHCADEDLEPRQTRCFCERRELRVHLRRDADAHLRVVTHTQPVHPSWRTAGLPP